MWIQSIVPWGSLYANPQNTSSQIRCPPSGKELIKTTLLTTDFHNAPHIRNYLLIADMHFHPVFQSEGGSLDVEHDQAPQYLRAVPGIVHTENGPQVISQHEGRSLHGKVFDGAGRVRTVAGDLPGSVGHYWGQYTEYDLMGRMKKQSSPTETSATGPNWAATGDDDPNNGSASKSVLR
jgi:hypothetical protein